MRVLSRRQKLTLRRWASVRVASGRRREYAAIASKCQWSWPRCRSMQPANCRRVRSSRSRRNRPSPSAVDEEDLGRGVLARVTVPAIAGLEDQGPGSVVAERGGEPQPSSRLRRLDPQVEGVQTAQVWQQAVVGLGIGWRGGRRRARERLRGARVDGLARLGADGGQRTDQQRHHPEGAAADRDGPAIHDDTVASLTQQIDVDW